MNNDKRRKWSRILQQYIGFFMIVCILAGALLGSMLAYIFLGEFPYEVLAGGIFVAILLTIIELIKRKVKSDKLPEADERTVKNLSRFFAYTSHITLAVLFLGLAVFTLTEHDSIPLLYLWIFFFAYLWMTGIGAMIVKRR